MGLFKEKTKVYEAKGKKEEWKKVRDAMKAAGLKGVSAGTWQDEAPVCGCGAKLDVRDFGPNGKIDRDIYTIRVLPEDAAQAAAIVQQLVPDYQPYVPSQHRVHI